MFQNLKSLLRAESGNVAMFLALGAIPLCAAVGAAVDYGRASSADIALQAATDAAALAVAADPSLSDKAAEKLMNNYMLANGIEPDVAKVTSVSITRNKKKGMVAVTAKGESNTSLMGIVGVASLEIGGFSQVQSGGQALELALVLDNTYSMTAEGRMDALKKASKELVGNLLDGKGDADIKISIVPFGEYVNVGVSNRNKLWLNVAKDTTKTETVDTYPNGKCLASEKQTLYSDGVPYTADVCTKYDYGDPVQVTQTYTTTWRGCVGSRPDPLDERIDKPSEKYPGLTDGWCNLEVLEPTKNKSKLTKTVDEMYPSGETYIPAGLLWGWNMLDASDPFGEAKSKSEMAEARGVKAIVLMTDGDNTRSRVNEWHWGSDAAAADEKTKALCENIKADGITVYTVALKVSKESSKEILRNCATSAAQAFNADDNMALVEAFRTIASNLMAVHLSK